MTIWVHHSFILNLTLCNVNKSCRERINVAQGGYTPPQKKKSSAPSKKVERAHQEKAYIVAKKIMTHYGLETGLIIRLDGERREAGNDRQKRNKKGTFDVEMKNIAG